MTLMFISVHVPESRRETCSNDWAVRLDGPSMFAVKAKIYGVLYNQASSVAFNETSSDWSALKSSLFPGFSLVTTR